MGGLALHRVQVGGSHSIPYFRSQNILEVFEMPKRGSKRFT